jgi:hypothetical protein
VGRMSLKLRPKVRITFMENFIMSGQGEPQTKA